MARYPPPNSGRAWCRISHPLRSRGPSAGGRGGATACFLAMHPGRWGQVGSPQMGLKNIPGQQDSSLWGPSFRPHYPDLRGSKAQPRIVWGGGPRPPGESVVKVRSGYARPLFQARRGQVGSPPEADGPQPLAPVPGLQGTGGVSPRLTAPSPSPPFQAHRGQAGYPPRLTAPSPSPPLQAHSGQAGCPPEADGPQPLAPVPGPQWTGRVPPRG